MEYTTIFGFNGINRQVSPFLTDTGDVRDSQNFVTESIGVLSKSFDYSIKGSQIDSGQPIIGAIDFQRNNGSHEHFVAIDGDTNAEVYKYDSGWTSQAQTLTKNYKVRFAYSPTIDTLFAVNYADATRSYNGTSWSTSTNVTDAAKGKYVISWGDRIYILNCKVGATSYPSRAYRSEAIETSAAWDTDNYVQFEDTITGVSTNGSDMFVGCQNSTYIFTLNDERYKMSDIGCISHDGISTYGRYTFYPAADGYYAFDGRETFKVSGQVQKYWDNIPSANWSDIQASVRGSHVYVYIGDIDNPDDSSETLQNVVFDYNILQNNWNRGRLEDECKNLHTYVTTTGRELFFGDDDGNIYQMFDGSGQQNGADYATHMETHWTYGSGAGNIDDFYEVWGYGDYLSGLKVRYKTEESEDWKDVGELNEDSDVVKFKVRAYKIRFRVDEFSGKNLFDLHRIDVGFEPAYQRDEDRTR